MSGRLVRLVLLDEDAAGLRYAQIAGRTTRVTACPFGDRKRLFARPEAQQPAIYVLAGFDTENLDRPVVYIGESESVAGRFAQQHHATGKAEWSEIFVVTSADGILNRAHALFVEDVLSQRLEGSLHLRNLTQRTRRTQLDEGDRAFAEALLEDAVFLIRLLGLTLTEATRQHVPLEGKRGDGAVSYPPKDGNDLVFEYLLPNKGAKGLMRPVDGGFLLLKGSILAPDLTATASTSPRVMLWRKQAREAKILVQRDDDSLELREDAPVRSVSLAAVIVAANNRGGGDLWVLRGTTTTYKDWDAAKNDIVPLHPDAGIGT